MLGWVGFSFLPNAHSSIRLVRNEKNESCNKLPEKTEATVPKLECWRCGHMAEAFH